MSRSQQRAYVQNNHLYRFPVDYSDLLATTATRDEDKLFNGSNSSGSLLLRHDAIYDSDFDFHQQRLVQNTKKPTRRKPKKQSKQCRYFNHLCLCLLVCLSFMGVFFYWSMWLVKLNYSKCESNYDETATPNSTNFHWVTITLLAS